MADEGPKYVKHEIPKNYDHYVMRARARNTALKATPKTTRDVEVERLERGFKIYVNGAHSEKTGAKRKTNRQKPAPRTAPSKSGDKRPSWSKTSRIEIKTERGTYATRAPDAYSEDFEIANDDEDASQSSSESANEQQHFSLVSLSINDVKKLRDSLIASRSFSDSESATPVASDDECELPDDDEDQPFVIEVVGDTDPEPVPIGAQRKDHAPIQLGAVARKPHAEPFKHFSGQSAASAGKQQPEKKPETRPGTQTLGTAANSRNLPVIGTSMELDATVRCADDLEDEAEQLDSDSSSKLSSLISQIRMLGNRQREQLLSALDKVGIAYGSDACDDTPPDSQRQANSSSAKAKAKDRGSYVTLEFTLCSNYGDPSRIGLTTLQLFDSSGSKLDSSLVDVSRIQKKNVRSETGQLLNLLSGRFKTTKEQQMWAAVFDPSAQVELSFPLLVPRTALSRVKIWNYNRPGDLNIGVKRMRIVARSPDNGAELLFDGDVDMGCGNPVIDYATTIDLTSSPSSSPSPSAKKSPTDAEEDGRDTVLPAPRGKTASRIGHTRLTSPAVAVETKSATSGSKRAPEPEQQGAVVPSWLQHALAKMNEERTTGQRGDSGLDESLKQQRIASREHDRMLEQSWDSLTYFNQTHAGRLHTAQVDLSADTLKASTANMNTLLDEALAGLYACGTRQNDPSVGLSKAFESIGIDDSKLCVVGVGRASTAQAGPGLGPSAAAVETPDEGFEIPELPSGRDLELDITTTWGDQYYVGLTGIEAFAADGHPIPVERVSAEPADINVLPEYGNDPRVAQNLIDGVNRTRDDVHMWLAPFTPGAHHYVRLRFAGTFQLALLRVWNYNKSRIHSSRGARLTEVRLDGRAIFRGEISRAHGMLHGGPELFGETILFTTDEAVLDRVAQNDPEFLEEVAAAEQMDSVDSRPETVRHEPESVSGGRPFTTAHHAVPKTSSNAASKRGVNKQAFVSSSSCLELQVVELWDPSAPCFGLNGIELLDDRGDSLRVEPEWLAFASASTPESGSEDAESGFLESLVNADMRLVVNDAYVWKLRSPAGQQNAPLGSIMVRLPSSSYAQRISGFRVWNANFNDDASVFCSGVKRVRYLLDGRLLSTEAGSLLRKAPGHSNFNFGQEIRFADAVKYTPGVNTRFVTRNGQPVHAGFVYQLVLLCSWDDPYYIGLNGIELFDHEQRKIKLSQKNVTAYPHSVKQLAGNEEDIRTPEKLIDDVNDALDGRHSWLTVIMPNVLNRLWIIFDHPVPVACIRLWNYSKTPQRGVRDFCLYVDDLLMHSGTLPMVNVGARGILPNCSGTQPVYSILLCEDESFQNLERNVIKAEDKTVAERSARAPDPNLRPSTCVPQNASKRTNRPSRQ